MVTIAVRVGVRARYLPKVDRYIGTHTLTSHNSTWPGIHRTATAVMKESVARATSTRSLPDLNCSRPLIGQRESSGHDAGSPLLCCHLADPRDILTRVRVPTRTYRTRAPTRSRTRSTGGTASCSLIIGRARQTSRWDGPQGLHLLVLVSRATH